jgi:Viral BACON domain
MEIPVSVRLWMHWVIPPAGAALFLCLSLILPGCAGSGTPTVATPPAPTPLLTSSISGGTYTQPVSRGSINSGGPGGPLGIGPCTLKAGSALMNFTARSGSSWFTVVPSSGTLQPNTSTSIGFSSINGTGLPDGRNTGFVTISASGYADNTQMGLVLDTSSFSTTNVTVMCN